MNQSSVQHPVFERFLQSLIHYFLAGKVRKINVQKRRLCHSFVSNSRYFGDYKEGKRDGNGVMIYPDGSKYSGAWKNGLKDGKGTYTFVNGDEFDGEWQNDLKHGRGRYCYKETGTEFLGTMRWLILYNCCVITLFAVFHKVSVSVQLFIREVIILRFIFTKILRKRSICKK